MNEDNFELLAKSYPDLLQKAQVDSFEVGNGWYNILDTLFRLISSKVDYTRNRIRDAVENKKDSLNLEEKLKKQVEDLPVILQVKEKFGVLRVYIQGGSDEIHNYISFAESISSQICEECGSPGKYRKGGWIKVLCDEHDEERHKIDY